MSKKTKLLVVAAHPDDEILGCGGTVAKLVKKNYEAHVVIVSQGITSRYSKLETKQSNKKLLNLKKSALKANKVLGVKTVSFLDFPDNRLDDICLLDIVKRLEQIIKKINPEIIFTHNSTDLNIDHKIVFDALITACRPLPMSKIKKILSFEVLSSTDWGTGSNNDFFNPNYYVDVHKTLNLKLKALKEYKSEMKKWPHARSIETVKALAKFRGSSMGIKAAESFKLIRNIE